MTTEAPGTARSRSGAVAPVPGEAATVTNTARPSRRGAQKPAPTLRILETRVLRGPNYWSRQPVVKMLVDLGVLEQFPSNEIPGFVEGLLAWKIGRASCRERV